MYRRDFVRGGGVILTAGLAGCLGNDDEDLLPDEESLRNEARENAENSVNTEGSILVTDQNNWENGDTLVAEFTLENAGDEAQTIEVDVVGYDGNGDLFFVETDSVGVLAPGESVRLTYNLDPANHDGIDEIIAYKIDAIIV